MTRLTVDGTEIEVADGATVLEAARAAAHDVPVLCFDERMDPFGACRVCLVGVQGEDGTVDVVPSCTTIAKDGMVVHTRDERARRVAGAVVELVLSELPVAPAAHTELAAVARELGVTTTRWPGEQRAVRHETDHPYLALRHELCISCARCVRACDEVQGTFALTLTGRGFHTDISAGIDEGFRASACVSCGACADTCPTDAITELSLLDLATAQEATA
ncbi:2Fe-2S iron-sulfur cluster-binding protein [Conexibacter sp. W3-3-2]|uniref:2Fe-2S iron-sulfur cluster-binding protein n=1 Tax=Conexibacter sp. W3-3-2 TaxID=2675227 RepID=UPI001E328A17|nr:2Fe-2S iron-sulfur cluster-binding protein [Conexibacter sp. W3-3-2]